VDQNRKRYKGAGGVRYQRVECIRRQRRRPDRQNYRRDTAQFLKSANLVKALGPGVEGCDTNTESILVPDSEKLVEHCSERGAMGAAGGVQVVWLYALAELPVTTTLLLRVIQGVAVEHGFAFAHAEKTCQNSDCIQVVQRGRGRCQRMDGGRSGVSGQHGSR